MPPWTLERAGARLIVAELGGMVEALLRLPDGSTVAPLFRPAWADTADAPAEPPLIGALRGEWLCAPFGQTRETSTLAAPWRGAAPPDPRRTEWLHGYGGNHRWHLSSQSPEHLAIAIDYPAEEPIARLERRLELAPDGSGFTVQSTIVARVACAIPVSFHGTFALPTTPGRMRLLPGRFARGYTHPTQLEPGRSIVAVDARFSDLGSVPAAAGGTLALDRLPLTMPAEEVVFLADTDGRFTLLDTETGVRTTITWDVGRLPHCHVWVSNRGRTAPPWNAGNICVGVEPSCAALDLGTEVSAGANPLRADGFATSVALVPGTPWQCDYTLSVAANAGLAAGGDVR